MRRASALGRTRLLGVEDLLVELGGVARRASRLRVVDRAELAAAVTAGLVERDSRGLYVLPGVADDQRPAPPEPAAGRPLAPVVRRRPVRLRGRAPG